MASVLSGFTLSGAKVTEYPKCPKCEGTGEIRGVRVYHCEGYEFWEQCEKCKGTGYICKKQKKAKKATNPNKNNTASRTAYQKGFQDGFAAGMAAANSGSCGGGGSGGGCILEAAKSLYDGGRSGGGSGDKSKSKKGVCYAFQRGHCERGSRCKYTHVSGSGGGGRVQSKSE